MAAGTPGTTTAFLSPFNYDESVAIHATVGTPGTGIADGELLERFTERSVYESRQQDHDRSIRP